MFPPLAHLPLKRGLWLTWGILNQSSQSTLAQHIVHPLCRFFLIRDPLVLSMQVSFSRSAPLGAVFRVEKYFLRLTLLDAISLQPAS